jgi:hypothetical protein
MDHDSDYFRRRAAEARAAACDKLSSHNSEVAGDLALAFAALARRQVAAAAAAEARTQQMAQQIAPQMAEEA